MVSFPLRHNSPLRTSLGAAGVDFLQHGLEAIGRILPHTVATWNQPRKTTKAVKTTATFLGREKKQVRLRLGLAVNAQNWEITGELQRRKILSGVGAIARTMDARERDLAGHVLAVLTSTLGAPAPGKDGAASLHALRATFDERVIARHLQEHHRLRSDLGRLFVALRQLAEQSYENKALSFGCIIEPSKKGSQGPAFPTAFFGRKRYRALSDGYNTAYVMSGGGDLLKFIHLGKKPRSIRHFFPEWTEDLASRTTAKNLAVALTRQGDLLVFDKGNLAFTYRFGHWQYWNHSHLVDLLRNAARVQRVGPRKLEPVVRAIYRAALDVSFKRSGGLFVLLRARKDLRRIVRPGEAIDDPKRDPIDKAFDSALGGTYVPEMERGLLAELAGLDGGVVLSNDGHLRAYGAILEPRKRGKITGTEGSRTKAAIGASNYGLAVKISSDGDISVFAKGTKLIEV